MRVEPAWARRAAATSRSPGPALGLSVARRFGRDGYRVALVARRRESLDALPDVETALFRADLLDPAQLTAAVAAIEDRFAHVGQLELLLPLAPIRLARLLLPGMRARGDGALLYASGVSAIQPMPQLGNAAWRSPEWCPAFLRYRARRLPLW